MTFIDHLSWRHAEKNFDPAYKLPPEKLDKVLEATRLAPSSFGLQPYHVYVVSDAATKAKLKEAGWHQAQYGDASHIMVFAARTDVNERIDQYINVATNGSKEAMDKMEGYTSMMRQAAESMDDEKKLDWAARQAYIALGFALAACAELEIDACPMEGFQSVAFDEILNLPPHIHSVVTLSLGKRKEEPQRPKVRFPKSELFTEI